MSQFMLSCGRAGNLYPEKHMFKLDYVVALMAVLVAPGNSSLPSRWRWLLPMPSHELKLCVEGKLYLQHQLLWI